jgi:hypothetical protein
MGGSAGVVEYGIPIVYDVSHLLDYLSSTLTHVADGRCVVSEFQSAPVAAGLASQPSARKSVAPPPCPSATHVLLFCNGSADSTHTVRRTAAQLLPRDRLTVLSVQGQSDAVVSGDALQTCHGSILLPAVVLAQLGLPPAIDRSPLLTSSTGLPLFMLSVHSGVSSVREKPLPATCFDSFAQLSSAFIVNAPDLSSTCIEFEGTLAGRPVRVLLDSGAFANFVNSDLVQKLSVRLWAFGISCKKQTGRQGTKLLQLQSIRLSAEYHTQLLDKTSIW